MPDVHEDDGTRLVVRCSKRLQRIVDAAADAAGMSRSEWMREALEASAVRDEHARSKTIPGDMKVGRSDARVLVTATAMQAAICLHPVHAREQRGLILWCKACETPLRRVG